jgi:hypothetical protein
MIGLLWLAMPMDNLSYWLLCGLAVIGAAALGGFGAGLIVQLSARLMTTRRVPRPVLRLVRLLGAITCGLLVAMALFRSGGPGGGGTGEGGGKDAGKGPRDINVGKDSVPKEQPKDNYAPELKYMHITVVPAKDGRYYRIGDDKQALTFAEVKDRVAFRRAQAMPFEKLIIVVYEDSPDQNTPIVQQLKTLAQDNSVTPEISMPKGKVP